jgi:TonB family protein
MTEAMIQPRKARWWTILALVFAAQLAIIFWLGSKSEPLLVPGTAGPTIHMAGEEGSELLRLTDPTLFALPHREGFSGAAWLVAPRPEIPPFAWTEPPRWMNLPVQQLGTAIVSPGATGGIESWPGLTPFEPQLLLPQLADERVFPTRSTLLVAGPLQLRPLQTRFELPSIVHTNILSNSVVQLLVDRAGTPFSVTLLASSGYKEADSNAMDLARRARFEPLDDGRGQKSPLEGLTWGEVVFQWHTVPASNGPASKP